MEHVEESHQSSGSAGEVLKALGPVPVSQGLSLTNWGRQGWVFYCSVARVQACLLHAADFFHALWQQWSLFVYFLSHPLLDILYIP